MSTSDYGAGATVYNGGSSAATTGTVDPLGYITRELEKKRLAMAGGVDGESDTRSGLAASALDKIGGTESGSSLLSSQTAMAPSSPVSASPTGALQYPQLQLPFDLDLATARTNYLDQYNQEDAQNQQGLQQAAQNRVTSQRSLDQDIPNRFRQLLNGFSGRGMAFSSGYGTGVVDTGQGVMNDQSGIDSAYADAQNQGQSNQLLSQKNFLQHLSDLALTQSQRSAAKAGTLGLDPNYKDPTGQAHGKASKKLGYSGGYKKAAAKKLAAKQATKKHYASPQARPHEVHKSQFLKHHPGLAAVMGTSKKKAFLRKHPHIAKELARY